MKKQAIFEQIAAANFTTQNLAFQLRLTANIHQNICFPLKKAPPF